MGDRTGTNIVQTLLNAKGVIVIIGAGVSIAAGIPSFRGQGCLEDNLGGFPLRDVMSARIREDESLRIEHCKLIADFAKKAIAARPTSFHHMLRALDNARVLVRLYTQNIDGLEGKVGFDLLDRSTQARCVSLHGSLTDLRCNNCSSTKSLESSFHLLKSGVLPECSSTKRALPTLRKRTGSCGLFYPDIVLYDDAVKDEDYIVTVANHDLRRLSKDTMLLVVGTSLQIPGIVEMIQQFGSVIRSLGGKAVYIDADPKLPPALQKYFGDIVKMDCESFSREVITELHTRGAEKLPVAELRQDMRPLWDWDYI